MQGFSSSVAATSTNDEVIVEKFDDKGMFTMNRPKVLNALNVSMIRTMTSTLKVGYLHCLWHVFIHLTFKIFIDESDSWKFVLY